MANNIDRQYKELLEHILHFGVEKKDRTGTGTKSIFGWQIRHRMSEGFPLLTTKKMAFKTMVTELLWFLRGDTSIEYLLENDCNIWTGDAYKNFLQNSEGDPDLIWNKEQFIHLIKTDKEFAKKWGELGPVYGQMWRDWDADTGVKIDQIANIINDLKTNPDSRRLMVNAWNPTYIPHCVLPPCHYGFQVYTRELSVEERIKVWNTKFGFANEEQKNQFDPNVHLDTHGIPTRAISLMWNQRSVDTALGWPINVASYSLLLMMLAKQVNMVPDEVICNLGDCHIYLDHVDGVKEQLTRQPMQLPIVKLSDRIVSDLSEYTLSDITLQNYESHPKIYFPLSN